MSLKLLKSGWRVPFALVAALMALALALARARPESDTLPQAIQVSGLTNVFRVTEHLYSGSQPEGDEAFAALRRLGVKSILSVDGAKPDAERAARFGLRYAHIPHGYDGISPDTAARLVRAAQELEGPIYLHCHHGRHRGPAAVGVICQATAGWTPEQSVAWMRRAGTSSEYAGLYRVNRLFHPPSAAELARVSTNFPSRAEVSGFVGGMVELDHRWENLRAIQRSSWRVPEQQPDLVPAQEALLLQEAFREILRGDETAARSNALATRLREAERQAGELCDLLKLPADQAGQDRVIRLDAASRAIAEGCASCHKAHRN
jgi:protein tyrosine phosphatase (PTP) superfamily phosphohydrolase (DUF442 family)